MGQIMQAAALASSKLKSRAALRMRERAREAAEVGRSGEVRIANGAGVVH